LDQNAGSGLLTWEILRRTPEGGAWALVRDRQAAEGLRQQAERLPELQRPVVLVGEVDEFSELLALRDESDLRFDAIVGRNALGPLPDKGEVLRRTAGWLRPRGRLSLAETVTRHSQRLYDLVELSPLGQDVRDRLIEAEEQIYSAPDDPLVNWDVSTLRSAVESAGFREVSVHKETQEVETLISSATLDRWFSTADRASGRAAGTGNHSRPSYAQHLLRRLTPGELAEVEGLVRQELSGQTVPWRSRLAFVVGEI
jgi:putative ATPase